MVKPIMLWGIPNVIPEMISYDADAVTIGHQRRKSSSPRYDFAKLLSQFECQGHMLTWTGNNSLWNENVWTQGWNWSNMGRNNVIGGVGFGYERDADGVLYHMPHLGNVVIGAGVEIGSNTCIDRAVVGSTVIGVGSKIDNLVHVAHGCKVGSNCLIIAGVVLGGSCEIGNNSYVGMGSLIKNKVKVGIGCTVGMGAVVLRDVPDGETWVGNPARKLDSQQPKQVIHVDTNTFNDGLDETNYRK